MKKIAGGYYYNVYDLGNGRVLKTQKNKLQIFIFILLCNKLNIKNAVKEFRGVAGSLFKIRSLYQSIFDTGIKRGVLGNPMLLGGINYEQDKVLMIKNKIKNISDGDFRMIVSDYINLIKKLWSFGLNESIYNFTLNNGYDRNNEIVLVDFNEMTFNIDDVEKDIKSKIWLKKSSYLRLDDGKKKIFRDLMDKEIIEESLKNYWGKK